MQSAALAISTSKLSPPKGGAATKRLQSTIPNSGLKLCQSSDIRLSGAKVHEASWLQNYYFFCIVLVK
jgi:hypothetical protein